MVQLAKANMTLEVDREKSFNSLRRDFRAMCEKLLSIEDPKESFNRFIMERHILRPYGRATPAEYDPLIPFSAVPLPRTSC